MNRTNALKEKAETMTVSPDAAGAAECDLLILCDGTVLVHNLTPGLAAILSELNSNDPSIRPRADAI